MSFSYELSTKDQLTTVKPKGRILDISEAEGLIKEVGEKIESGSNKLIFNMKDLEYMNSAGLNMLINLLTKSRNHSGEMVLCELSDSVSKLMITSKLQNIFSIEENEAEAIKKLN
jgi:anti-anti-sigma factor